MLIYSIQIEVTREMIRSQIGQQAFSLQDTIGKQLSRPVHVGGYDPATSLGGGVLFDFLRKTFHRFSVNQKVQSEGPTVKYPTGPNIHVFATTTDVEVATSSVPSPRDQLAFVLPIWLRPNIAYVALLKPNATLGIGGTPVAPFGNIIPDEGYANWSNFANADAHAGFDVRVTLEGLLKRPVV
jgi:hypothetical protein